MSAVIAALTRELGACASGLTDPRPENLSLAIADIFDSVAAQQSPRSTAQRRAAVVFSMAVIP